MKTVTLSSIVDELHRLEPDQVSVDRVREVLSEGSLDEASLRSYVGFRDDAYVRRLVHRSELFDVMVLSWRPGQVTPVHDHSGQLGWVRLVRGRIEEQRYGCAEGADAVELASVDLDDDGVGHGVDLAHFGTVVVAEVGAVASVDRRHGIHSLGNPRQNGDDDGAVTLHVYSRPHDSCLCFDPEQRTCWRRELGFENA